MSAPDPDIGWDRVPESDAVAADGSAPRVGHMSFPAGESAPGIEPASPAAHFGAALVS